MPLIVEEIYCIDFLILETDDPRTITLLDRSTYIGVPESPLVDVTLPGYTGYVSNQYTTGGLIVLDGYKLDLFTSDTCSSEATLPDGVYQITLKVCPYNELFKKKCYLKTTRFQQDYELFLLNIDNAFECFDKRELTERLMDIDLLIQSAKAEAGICNIDKATEKYRMAVKKLAYLNKKLNCK